MTPRPMKTWVACSATLALYSSLLHQRSLHILYDIDVFSGNLVLTACSSAVKVPKQASFCFHGPISNLVVLLSVGLAGGCGRGLEELR